MSAVLTCRQWAEQPRARARAVAEIIDVDGTVIAPGEIGPVEDVHEEAGVVVVSFDGSAVSCYPDEIAVAR